MHFAYMWQWSTPEWKDDYLVDHREMASKAMMGGWMQLMKSPSDAGQCQNEVTEDGYPFSSVLSSIVPLLPDPSIPALLVHPKANSSTTVLHPYAPNISVGSIQTLKALERVRFESEIHLRDTEL